MKFLSATWTDLLLANYEVDSGLLAPYVPERTSIDAFDGRVFVSLVAFMFRDTAVLGVPAWWRRDFEEVNLRFYVRPDRDPSIRGVTFIQEIVPSSLIPLVANTLFHENYVRQPMGHLREANRVGYYWGAEDAIRFSARLEADLDYPPRGTLAEFITEHYWGYAKGPRATLEYEVTHPQWKGCEVEDYEIDVDFKETYGERFAFLNESQPFNVLYAEGSPVTVSFPGRI